MTNPCPRCSTPQLGNYPICQRCGFDFRSAAGPAMAPQQLPAQQSLYGAPQRLAQPTPQQLYPRPASQFQAAPSTCPRCSAPLYPGYAQCTSCGYDLRAAWGTAAPVAAPPKRSILPVVLTLLGVGVLAFAGTFLVTRSLSNSVSSPSPAPSAVAAVSSSSGMSPTHDPVATPVSSGPLNPVAPDTAWITFSPTGSGFTSKFPAEPKLTTQTVKTAAGDAPTSVWLYAESAHLAFFTGLGKYPKGTMTGINPSGIYDGALNGMASSTSLTLDKQNDVTLDGHAGRAFTMSGSIGTIRGAIYFVGDDLYMVYGAYDSSVTDLSELDAFIADYHLTV